jgi:hypothetical protein
LDQLRLWINNIQILEKELGCKYDAEPIEQEYLNKMEHRGTSGLYMLFILPDKPGR